MWRKVTLLSDLTEGGDGALLVTRVQSVFEPVRHAALREREGPMTQATTKTTNTPINADDARSNQEEKSKRIFGEYRMTIEVVTNLPLTPKQSLLFSTWASY